MFTMIFYATYFCKLYHLKIEKIISVLGKGKKVRVLREEFLALIVPNGDKISDGICGTAGCGLGLLPADSVETPKAEEAGGSST